MDKINMDKINMDKINMDKTNMDKINMDKINMDKINMDKINMDKINMDKIHDFYKLKKKYDNKHNKKKNIILNNENLNNTQKKELILSLSKYCVNCNNKGGTSFIITNKLLAASCNSKNKCKLNINIEKQIQYNVRDEYYKILTMFNAVKLNILKIKNDVINKLINKEEAIELFSNYENDFKDLEIKKTILLDKYNNIINNPNTNIEINNLMSQLNLQIDEIKFNIHKYVETNNNINIKNAINIYNDINKINNKINNLKYYYYNVECGDNTEIPCKEKKYNLITDNYNNEAFYKSNIYS
jgi:hypothetical protein